MIYLDNAATTFPKSEKVYQAVDEWQRTGMVNAGRGGYQLARKASDVISETREKIAKYTGAIRNEDVVFTDSATTAANFVLKGIEWKENDCVLVSPYEHNAIMRTIHSLIEKYNLKVEVMPCKKDGAIDMDGYREFIQKAKPRLLCMTQASNVTGYVLPYAECFKIARENGCETLLDTAQGLGVIPVNMTRDYIDYLIFAGHKNLYGIFGTGGFINGSGNELNVVLHGGTGSDSLNMEMQPAGTTRYEVGSPNVLSIAALNVAMTEVLEQHQKRLQHEQELAAYLREHLKEIPFVQVYDIPEGSQNVGIVSFASERYMADELGMILDEDFDIAVRSGYHCAPLVHDVIGSKKYGGTVRVGIGQFNTKEELDRLIEAVRELMEE